VVERLGLAARVQRLWRPLRHGYALMVVMVGWVFFRAETLPAAIGFLRAMVGAQVVTPGIYTLSWHLTPDVSIALVAGAIGSTPIVPALAAWYGRVAEAGQRLALALPPASTAALAALLVASIMQIAARTYNPFIYFRF
jgi:alginate O-acetyltransferase complex protein AlgI